MKNLVYHVQNLFSETKRRIQQKSTYLEIYDCSQKLIAITKKMDHTITEEWTDNDEKEHQDGVKAAEQMVLKLDCLIQLAKVQGILCFQSYYKPSKSTQDVKDDDDEGEDDEDFDPSSISNKTIYETCVKEFEDCTNWLTLDLIAGLRDNSHFDPFQQALLEELKRTSSTSAINHVSAACFVIGSCYHQLTHQEKEKKVLPSTFDRFFVECLRVVYSRVNVSSYEQNKKRKMGEFETL